MLEHDGYIPRNNLGFTKNDILDATQSGLHGYVLARLAISEREVIGNSSFVSPAGLRNALQILDEHDAEGILQPPLPENLAPIIKAMAAATRQREVQIKPVPRDESTLALRGGAIFEHLVDREVAELAVLSALEASSRP